ncbi:MAG: F0F1 ATP synthase subunit A [Oscillospiraceae bacterium]|nr:F0F1 ATP synthase subunit A [Oscillospiraceae bacterium]
MDISIGVHGVINIGNIQILITDTVISTWIIMGVLIAFAIFVRIKVCGFKEIPTGFQNVIEALIEVFENYLRNTVGSKLMFLGNWFFTLFLFILVSNISGATPGFRPPTADWSMTVALAIVTFVLIQAMGIKYRGLEYVLSFFKPFPLFLPVNLIGELARPIAISFRLFGNMLAGLIMMSLIYALAPLFAQFLLPAALHIYFDLFAGLIQTYIFVTLSMAFVSSAAKLEEE